MFFVVVARVLLVFVGPFVRLLVSFPVKSCAVFGAHKLTSFGSQTNAVWLFSRNRSPEKAVATGFGRPFRFDFDVDGSISDDSCGGTLLFGWLQHAHATLARGLFCDLS